MGFAWLLRETLRAGEGDAPGRALVEALVLPVFYARVRDIPEAAQEVLLRDVREDGSIPHRQQIEAAASAKGLTVQSPRPAGPLARLAAWAAGRG
jgi:hypothetical protein